MRVAADKMIQMSHEIGQCSQRPENAENGELTEGDTGVDIEEGIDYAKSD